MEKSLLRRMLLVTTAAAGLSGTAFAQAAPAAEQPEAPAAAPNEPVASEAPPPADAAADPAPAGGLEEVTVTARRVEENIQKVPIAVTAVTGDRLKALNIADATQLTKQVPGVNLCCNVFNSATNTFVRGIAQGAPTYFADVPVQPVGYGNFFDISSVQILKGPQGTLFGQASNAGAFVYQPRRPGNELGGYVSAMAGSYDRRNFEAAVDIPFVEDRVLFRIAGISASRRGYVLDLANNDWYGNEDYWIVRPSLTLKITDRLENYTLFQHSHAKNTGETSGIWVLEDFNFVPGQVSGNAGLVALNGGTQAAFDALRVQLLLQQRELGRYRMNGLSVGCQNGPVFGPSMVTTLNYPSVACGRDVFVENRVVNTTTFEVTDDWTVKNIFGWSGGHEYRGPSDIDGTKLILTDTRSPRQQKPIGYPTRYSDELQVQGNLGIVDLTAGLFYFRSRQNTGLEFTDFNVTARSVARRIVVNESKAVYGQANVRLDSFVSGLTATGGLRYTKDKIEQTTFNYNNTTLQVTSISGGPNSPAGRAKFDNVAYTAGLQWQVTPQTMLFVTNSRGYNSGGLQNVAGAETFQPSVLTNYEAGIKSTFRLGGIQTRFNASAFYGNFDDVQVNVFDLITDSATGLQRFTTVTRNAAKAKVRGFEAELDVIPVRGLQLGGFVGYTSNKYTEFPSFDLSTTPPTPIDLSDTPFLFAPKWKLGGRASYELPLPETIGQISLNADWTYRTRMINRTIPLRPTNPANPITGLVCTRDRTVANGYPAAVADGKKIYIDCVAPAHNLDMGARWRNFLGHEGLAMDFQVTNVTKNIIMESQANVPASGYISRQPAVPRMWTIRATYNF